MSLRVRSWTAFTCAVLLWTATPFTAHAQSCDAAQIERILARGYMPDLRNCTPEMAARLLKAAGHSLAVEKGTSNNVEPGTIFDYSPDGKTRLEPSAKVMIWVSTGPVPEDTFTDVAVRAGEGGETNVPVGEKIGFQFIVENKGTATIPRVVVRSDSANLDEVGTAGDCRSLPCDLVRLEPGASKQVLMIGVTHAIGPYNIRLVAKAPNDIGPDNDDAGFEGDVVDVPQPPPTPASVATPVVPAPASIPSAASVAGPVASNRPARAMTPVEEGASQSDLLISVDLLDERWIKGKRMHFQIKLWNRGSHVLKDVVVEVGTTSNLGTVTLPPTCEQARCIVASIPTGEMYIIQGEFELPQSGEASAEFPVSWGKGRNARRTVATIAGEVGSVPWFWIIAATVGVLAVVGSLKLFIPKGPAWWDPRIRVRPIIPDIGDVALLDEPALTAPPLRIVVTVAHVDAAVDSDLPVRKKDQ